MDGGTFVLALQGATDVVERTVNITVLVAPIRFVERVMDRLPLVRRIFAEPVVAVPVTVSGPLENPVVTLLSPSAVGASVVGILGRALSIPFDAVHMVVNLPGTMENGR